VSASGGEIEFVMPTCVVRPWRASDAASIARHADNPKIGRNLRDGFPSPYTVDDARAFIQRAIELQPLCRFAIVVDGEAAGSIGFTLHANVERVGAEIGYFLGEAYWGRGITADAVRAVTAYAITAHGLTRVYAVPYAWNPASFRVLEKAGFSCEGRMRRSAIKDGEIVDQLLYAFVVAEPGNPDTALPPDSRD
jgi:[ribosomal protein S5]-alanine N-acetyltransferase